MCIPLKKVAPIIRGVLIGGFSSALGLWTSQVWPADYTITDRRTTGLSLSVYDTLYISESGSIDVQGTTIDPLRGFADSIQITVDGSIYVGSPANGRYGIELVGSSTSIIVNGLIDAIGNDARGGGITSGGSNLLVEVNGTLSTTGPGIATGNGNSNTINLTGSTLTSGNQSHGILLYDASYSSITVSGSILTRGNNAIGVFVNGLGNNTVDIFGSVRTEGLTAPVVSLLSSDNSVNISGTIASSGGVSNAIENYRGTSNIFKLNRGSRIIGGIYLRDAGGTTGNTLRFDVGSAMSYVYNTTGSWTLEDMDGRAVVAGSAMAAGTGNAETADEVQFDRLSRLNQGIRLMPTVAANSPRSAWATPYGFSSKRSASASDPTVTKYKSNAYGIVAGRPISRWGDKADLVIQLDQNDLDIDDADQTIKTTTARVGLLASQLAQVKGFDLSARALLGYNLYDSTRKVLVNTNTTTGLTTYDASFKSWELLIGGSANGAFQLNATTQLNTQARLDLAYESIGAYSEGDYFSWKNRKLLQSVAGLSTELERQHTPNLRSKASLQLDRRNLISGKTTDYAINGTNVSFTGGDTTDTIATLGLGLTYKAKKNLTLTTDFTTSRSNNSLTSKSAQLRVNYLF